jgi:hypothetical protein
MKQNDRRAMTTDRHAHDRSVDGHGAGREPGPKINGVSARGGRAPDGPTQKDENEAAQHSERRMHRDTSRES